MLPLTTANLASLPSDVAVPAYDRSQIRVGIVHLGVGGFHRAHEAMYLDRLMNAGLAGDWGICGVGVLPSDRGMAEVLAAQDHLYTLVVKHPDGRLEPRVIGSIVDYVFAPDDPQAAVERLAAASTRVVTLTITEGGYDVDDVTGAFDATTAGVVWDLAHPGEPRTAFGLVVEALRRRRERGVEPFAVLSCDNLVGNGDVARTAFGGFAELRDPALGTWVADNVPFPSSVVDRITPVSTDADREALREQFGVEDRVPVVCEPFVQ